MKDKKVWQLIYDCLQKGIFVALLIVVDSKGSTPGRTGFKMAVASDETLAGTIGGGIIEYNFIKKTLAKLKNGDLVPILQQQIHNDEATTNRSGMICGGIQTVVLYPCQKNELATIQHLVQSVENYEGGTLHLSPIGISFTFKQYNVEHYKFQFEAENEWQYEENVGLTNTAYLIGGGHIGLALSRLLATLDFHIIVLDERPEVSTLKNNIYAHQKIILSYDEIQAYIPEGEQNYVIIMTSSHQTDKLILQQLIDKKLCYLGMMGSVSKVKKIFEHLQQEGISQEKLQRIYAPIGLPINSHTPAEIAVSIVAEMLKIQKQDTKSLNGVAIHS